MLCLCWNTKINKIRAKISETDACSWTWGFRAMNILNNDQTFSKQTCKMEKSSEGITCVWPWLQQSFPAVGVSGAHLCACCFQLWLLFSVFRRVIYYGLKLSSSFCSCTFLFFSFFLCFHMTGHSERVSCDWGLGPHIILCIRCKHLDGSEYLKHLCPFCSAETYMTVTHLKAEQSCIYLFSSIFIHPRQKWEKWWGFKIQR